MTEQVVSPADLLTVTNPRLEQHGVDFITDRIDPEKLSGKPLYSIGEVAKFFFGRTAHWIRFHEREDIKWFSDDPAVKKPDRPSFVLDGERIQFVTTPHGSRVYSLDTVEKMAHALAQNLRIQGQMLNNVLTLVEAEARVYDYI